MSSHGFTSNSSITSTTPSVVIVDSMSSHGLTSNSSITSTTPSVLIVASISTYSVLIVASITTSSTSPIVVEASTASPVTIPSISSHTKCFFVQLLLSFPIISNHFAFTSFQGLAADVVKEALLFVIIHFVVLILNFSLLTTFYHVIFNSHFFLTIFFMLDFSSVINLGSAQFVHNLLELIIGLFKIIIVIKLQS